MVVVSRPMKMTVTQQELLDRISDLETRLAKVELLLSAHAALTHPGHAKSVLPRYTHPVSGKQLTGLSSHQLAARLGFGDLDDPRVQIEWQGYLAQIKNFKRANLWRERDPQRLSWAEFDLHNWVPVLPT